MPVTPSAEAKPSETVSESADSLASLLDFGDISAEDLKNIIFANISAYVALRDNDSSDSDSNDVIDTALATDVTEDPADPRHFTFSYENSRFDIFTDENGIAQMCCVTVGKSDHYALMAPSVLSAFEPGQFSDALQVFIDLGKDCIASGEPIASNTVGNTLVSLSVVDDEVFYILINHDAMSLDKDYYMGQMESLL